MKVGIISDIHDNIWRLSDALERLERADVLICCGDLCSPFIVDRMANGFGGPTHVVFGNNDADLYRITVKASQHPHFHLHGEFAELEIDGQRFAVSHFDNIGRSIAASGRHDVVCYGHSHVYETLDQDGTLCINPGEIMGGLSEPPVSTCAVYETSTRSVVRIELGGPVSSG